jgi:hypothetical protein
MKANKTKRELEETTGEEKISNQRVTLTQLYTKKQNKNN